MSLEPSITAESASSAQRQRRFLPLAIVIALILGALASFTTYRQSMAINALLITQTESLTRNIATLSLGDVAANDRAALATRLEGLNDFSDLQSVSITDRQGQPLAAVVRNAAGNLSATQTASIESIGSPNGINSNRSEVFLTGNAVVRWRAIGEIAPIGWVRVEYSTHSAIEARTQILLDTLIAAAAAWLVALAALLFFLRSNRRTSDHPG